MTRSSKLRMLALAILLVLVVQTAADSDGFNVEVTWPYEGPRGSAFMVAMNEHYSPSNFNSGEGVLKFDTVVTNLGDDYNVSSGVYTVPVTGTYTFTLRFAAPDDKEAAGRLMVNDESQGKVWVTSIPQWASASGTWILRLSQGQRVWVQHLSKALHYYGNWYCALTGSLLYEG